MHRSPVFRCALLSGRAFALFLSLTIVLTPALAAPAPVPATTVVPTIDVTRILRVKAEAMLNRGAFIKAAIRTLGIEPEKGKRDLPYGRIPATLRPSIQTADTFGALAIFAGKLDLQKPITRGEAVSILAALTGLKPAKTDNPYADVRGEEAARAANLAVEKGWIKADSGRSFGWRRALKGKDGLLLLQRVSRTQGKTPEVPRIIIPLIKDGATDRSIPKEDILRSVWGILRDDYLYDDRLDADKAGDQSIEGAVNSLKDPYTRYFPKPAAENLHNQLRSFEGIGASVEQTGGIVRIVTPLKGSPAEKAGLLPLDEILSADGVSLTGLSLDEAVSKIRGPKGSTARLRIRRLGNEFDVSVVRDTVHISEVEVTMQGDIAVVKIDQFGETTDTELRSDMRKLQERRPRGIILDLRNNPGGFLHTAGVTISNFVPKGTPYVMINTRDASRLEKTTDEPTIDPSIPMVVLVNSGSASASEIVAAALQEVKRAIIVGIKTYGKGTVQQVINFVDGSSLKMTVAEWKTPLGHKIDGVGVQPDVEVVNEPGGRDGQQLKAFDLLR